jgi:hypothetical protein
MTTIKKTILLALVSLMMVECRYRVTGRNVKTASNSVVVVDENTSDSCEYYPHYGHKGNCRFCKERDSIKWKKRKKELEELIIKLKEK